MIHAAELTYCGIGSRVTPPEIADLMRELAVWHAWEGWTLRSGGSGTADEAFAAGHASMGPGWTDRIEIYLPWARFGGGTPFSRADTPTEKAYQIAEMSCSYWHRLAHASKKLYARNVHVALGKECDAPAARAVCWTPDGALDGRGPRSGGTGHTLRVLLAYNPRAEVINLARDDHRQRMSALLAGRDRTIAPEVGA